MLFKEALEEFLFNCEVEGLAKETLKNYTYNVKKFLQFAEENNIFNVEELNKQICKSYVIYLRRQEYEESYINTSITTTNLFLKYMYEEGYVDELLNMKIIKEKDKVIETFTNEEVQAMLKTFKKRSYIDIRDKTIMMMMVDCGLRAGEICKLRTTDIKNNMTLFIQGKGKKERYVPFSPALKKQMMKYERVKESYFMDEFNLPKCYFLTNDGRQITRFVLQWMVAKVGEKAGVPKDKCFPHNFRHYFAVSSLKNGLDLYSLSRVLGHSEIQTTTFYANSIKDEEIQELSLQSSPLMNLKGGRK